MLEAPLQAEGGLGQSDEAGWGPGTHVASGSINRDGVGVLHPQWTSRGGMKSRTPYGTQHLHSFLHLHPCVAPAQPARDQLCVAATRGHGGHTQARPP